MHQRRCCMAAKTSGTGARPWLLASHKLPDLPPCPPSGTAPEGVPGELLQHRRGYNGGPCHCIALGALHWLVPPVPQCGAHAASCCAVYPYGHEVASPLGWAPLSRVAGNKGLAGQANGVCSHKHQLMKPRLCGPARHNHSYVRIGDPPALWDLQAVLSPLK